ncbi:MAG: carbohydrate porin [Thiobacillus sp.]|uniref:carbohydrate porin n=1 Tax=Thiobacillus sp. TaxID=924 RepID=UPI0027338D62|nr:carbohydrate porin [Thiobacillus sp.]MDP3584776.1 carbohydrate porin [Thiobacillus sp.]
MKNLFRLTALLSALGTALPLHAMPYATPDTWGGDLSSRARLTGDWGGARDDMAKKGVVLDLDLYWMPQGIISGGKDEESGSWGNAIATLNVDTQKAGFWPGGFFKVQTVTSFGDNIMRDTGAMVPANLSWMLPTPTDTDTGLQEFTYTQFLSQHFGVFLGKINSIAPTNVLHGDYTTGFLNTSVNMPLALAMVPLSAYGAGALYLPSHDVTLAAMVLDPNGTIMNDDLGDAFDDGVMALVSADLKIKPGGLPGHQNLTLAWSNKDRTSLIQDPANVARLLLNSHYPLLGNPGPVLIEIFDKLGLPATAAPLNQESETWAAVYSFEQFVWQPAGDPKRGIGMFFSAGVSDGKANPIKYSYSLGLVGKGVVPGRPRDDFGIGWARTEFSDDFLPHLRTALDLGLDHEDAVELYYNAAVTPWLNVSPSLQIISPALNKALDANGNFQNLDTTYIAGVRVGIRF